MKIFLKSNFRDYYDHWFAAHYQNYDCIFIRNSFWGMARNEMFHMFKKNYFSTPKNGTIENLKKKLNKSDKIVVYIDLYAHRSKGKVLCTLEEALEYYPNFYASQYIEECTGKSFRWLKIGDQCFWLIYTSDNWQSNKGNVDIKILSHLKKENCKSKIFLQNNPLIAIDYVANYRDTLLAIDFNISPGIIGTRIEKILTAKEIYTEIENFYKIKKGIRHD